MLLPIRVAVATSMLIILLNTSIAGWVYIAKGAVLPDIAVPATVGMALGSKLGASLALKVRPAVIRQVVLIILLIAASTNIYKGLTGVFG